MPLVVNFVLTFTTKGRGDKPGVRFVYSVSRATGNSGHHYNGRSFEDYGNEIYIKGHKKGISLSTIELAVENALAVQNKEGHVKSPKLLGTPGAESYLYPLFIRLGIISTYSQ